MFLKLLAISTLIACSSFSLVTAACYSEHDLQAPSKLPHKAKSIADRQREIDNPILADTQKEAIGYWWFVPNLLRLWPKKSYQKNLNEMSVLPIEMDTEQQIPPPSPGSLRLNTTIPEQISNSEDTSTTKEAVSDPLVVAICQITPAGAPFPSHILKNKAKSHRPKTESVSFRNTIDYCKFQRKLRKLQHAPLKSLETVTFDDLEQWKREAYGWSRTFSLRNGWEVDRTPNSIQIRKSDKIIAKASKAAVISPVNRKNLIIQTDENSITIRHQSNLITKAFLQLHIKMTELDFCGELMRGGLYQETNEEREATEDNCDWLDSETVYLRSQDPEEPSKEPMDYFTLAVWEGCSGTLYEEKKWHPLEIKFEHLQDRIYMRAYVPQEIREFVGILNNGKILRLYYQMSRSEFLHTIRQTGLMTESQRWPKSRKYYSAPNMPDISIIKRTDGTCAYFADLLDITEYIQGIT